jgi:hypothetical protein
MSADGGKTFEQPVRVSEDDWVLNGCPENGPALTVDANRRIHVVWPTLVPGATSDSEPTLALFYATSKNGHEFTRRQRIPTEGFLAIRRSPLASKVTSSSSGTSKRPAIDELHLRAARSMATA